MVKHIKPTEEDIKIQLESTIKELDATPETSTTTEIKATEEQPKKKEEEVEKTTPPVTETKQEEKTTENTEEDKETADYKKKFTHSARENQVLYSQVKKLTEAITTVGAVPDPTDEEMTKLYGDWDIMDETMKKLAKDNYKNNIALSRLSSVSKESQDIEAWNQKVDTFVEDPKTLMSIPELEGKQEEFKLFASKATRRGLEFDDLVSAFLFDVSKNVKPNKGKMFEQGTGGSNTIVRPHSDKISVEEGALLRQTNYKKWREYVTAGKIDTASID